jgi:4-aminobutyrate aminotransferase
MKNHHPSSTEQIRVDLSEGDSNMSSMRKAWHKNEIDANTRRWLALDERYFLRQTLSTPCLNVLESCKDSFITDLQGKQYLDFHGNSVHQVGFSHPKVIDAIIDQLKKLSFCTRRYTNIPAIELAKKLSEIAPGNLSKVLFAPGGTTAVGMALKLARAATGRFKTISMWDSFHGASLDCMSISGETMFRKNVGPLLPGAVHVPPADPYRCLWDPEGKCEICGLKCAEYIDYVMEKDGDVSALIAEPVRNTAVNPPPPGYWKAVRKSCDRHGALLIFDETAICLGRTGKMFACENFDVVPDILTIGKGVGGGIMPFAAMIAQPDLDVAPEKGLGHFTHEKNPVASAAALATISVIENNNLAEHACRLGKFAENQLNLMKNKHDLIGDVRGIGLLMGIDLVRDRKTKQRAISEAEQIMYECLKRGLSFKTSQGSFIPLSPSLTIEQSELERALDILDEAITVVEN